ncbi:GTP-binding protein [Methanobacterium alcaliphilum]|uniref:GTP-binding protein n=1 Tax=Methanobacterium alcaliphilum TaxID=392018 RepID=UPI00200A1866|nr:GTP-binding protein [Methanobacterium alcaliphilum]MCK9151676.1 GTP-binding protein [Methanobacterium alcaliphilum]
MSEKTLKIVVFGALNAGKTSIVERLSGQELFLKGDYENITTSFDFVQIERKGFLIHLFASPGHRRFSFMWDTLAFGMDGAILVIDSTVGVTPVDIELINFIQNHNVPFSIAANKNDISNIGVDQIRKEMEISKNIEIWNTSALNDYNLNKLMDGLIQDISNGKSIQSQEKLNNISKGKSSK